MMAFDRPASSDGATGATDATGATVAPCSGRCYSPLCNKGVAASHRTTAQCKSKPEPWPPKELALPANVEAIEAGRQEQRELFQPDDSRSARLSRLTAPGAARQNQAFCKEPPL
jgi:hypothetical protein